MKSDSFFQQSGFPRAFGIGLASGFAGRDKFLSVFGLGSTEYEKNSRNMDWSMEYGVWSTEYGVLSVEYGVHKYGVRSTRVWSTEYRSTEYGVQHLSSEYTGYGVWSIAAGVTLARGSVGAVPAASKEQPAAAWRVAA